MRVHVPNADTGRTLARIALRVSAQAGGHMGWPSDPPETLETALMHARPLCMVYVDWLEISGIERNAPGSPPRPPAFVATAIRLSHELAAHVAEPSRARSAVRVPI
jgi:hypothetical protein